LFKRLSFLSSILLPINPLSPLQHCAFINSVRAFDCSQYDRKYANWMSTEL